MAETRNKKWTQQPLSRGRKNKKRAMLPTSAPKVHRVAMGEATIPVEGGLSPMSVLTLEKEKPSDQIASYITTTPTESQLRELRGECLCMCPPLLHCGKIATLHKPPCSFCYGFSPGGPPFLLRYYPTDNGWWTLRHQVKRLRKLAGLEEFKEILPPQHPPYHRPSIQAYPREKKIWGL